MTADLSRLKLLGAALSLAGLLASGQAMAAATIIINNTNAAGVGFNETTPAAPVGGNSGTTLGEQRLIAFQYAAQVWGNTLTTDVPIIVNASFTPLTCTATTGVLGSASNTSSLRNFAGAPFTDTWYPVALRNKYVGAEANPGVGQITANFNSRLGLFADCLPGSGFYLGLDNNVPTGQTNVITVLLHELGHGLGFSVNPTSSQTGVRSGTSPSIWERFMFDNAANKLWLDMSNAERAASSISFDKLVWAGATVTAGVPSTLRLGAPLLNIGGPAAGVATGTYPVGEASFGAPLSNPPLVGQVMPVATQVGATGPGCDPFDTINRTAVRNNIALIDRGACAFVIKVKNAQDAGAIGVLIADNAVGSVTGLGGADPSITIPAVRITLADGNAIKEQLKRRSRTSSGVTASLGLDLSRRAGADAAGRIKLYAPNPFVSGSSVSHYDTSATRNQLMEPAINTDLTQTLIAPIDLTFPLLQDIGW